MKKLLTIIALLFAVQISMSAADSATLSNVRYDAQKKAVVFTISYTGAPGDAWVGVVPAGTPKNEKSADKVDLVYRYLKEFNKSGEYSLHKELSPGTYELHVYANDDGGSYLCGKTFTVGSGQDVKLETAYWDNSKQAVCVKVSFGKVENDAWIGLVPVNTPKNEKDADRVDIVYKYLKDIPNGQSTYLKPSSKPQPGKYEIQIYANDNGGKYLGGKVIEIK